MKTLWPLLFAEVAWSHLARGASVAHQQDSCVCISAAENKILFLTIQLLQDKKMLM